MNEKKSDVSLKNDKPKDNGYVDNYHIVYMFFALIGIVQFLPATFFTTANDFWMYKFRNTSFAEIDSDHRTTLQKKFSACVTIFSFTGTVSLSFLALFVGQKINFKLRLYGSLLLILIFYIIAAILINVNTDSWQMAFFVLTMFLIYGINGIGALFGMTFYTVLAKFPKSFLGPFLNGQAISGILTGVLQVMALAVGISTKRSAMVYFWIAIGIISFCILYMYSLHKYNNFFQHYNNQELPRAEKGDENKVMTLAELRSTFKLVWKSLALLLFYIWATSPTHPAITALVVSEGERNGDWNDVYFVPVVTFLLWSVMDIIGRQIPIKIKFFTKIDPIWHVAFSALRMFLMVPLIMLCNAQPRNHLPVVFPHDYQYIIIMMVTAISGGFLMCIGQLIIPEIVPPEKLDSAFRVNLTIASVLMAAFSFMGIVSVDIL